MWMLMLGIALGLVLDWSVRCLWRYAFLPAIWRYEMEVDAKDPVKRSLGL